MPEKRTGPVVRLDGLPMRWAGAMLRRDRKPFMVGGINVSRGYLVSILHDDQCRIVSATHDHGELVPMTITVLEDETLLDCPACDALVRVEAARMRGDEGDRAT